MDNREWVQDHWNKIWHWYNNGYFSKSLCGKPSIPGSPLVSYVPPSNSIICETCLMHWYLRNETQQP